MAIRLGTLAGVSALGSGLALTALIRTGGGPLEDALVVLIASVVTGLVVERASGAWSAPPRSRALLLAVVGLWAAAGGLAFVALRLA